MPPLDLPAAAREDYEERAAIMEYEGGLSRRDAERAAYELILRRHALAEPVQGQLGLALPDAGSRPRTMHE